MNRISYLITTIFMLLLLTSGAVAANSQLGTAETTILGIVTFKSNSVKLDHRSRKNLEPALRKLMKYEERKIVKIEGDFATANNEVQYLTNSLLMSQEVEQYLTSALGSKHEILVSASKFAPSKSPKLINKVTIYLLPLNFRIETIAHERLPIQLLKDQPASEPPSLEEETQVLKIVPKAKTPEELAAEKKAAEQRRAEEQQLAVDMQKADELVIKEKARAAVREKKLKAEEDKLSQLPNPNEK